MKKNIVNYKKLKKYIDYLTIEYYYANKYSNLLLQTLSTIQIMFGSSIKICSDLKSRIMTVPKPNPVVKNPQVMVELTSIKISNELKERIQVHQDMV